MTRNLKEIHNMPGGKNVRGKVDVGEIFAAECAVVHRLVGTVQHLKDGVKAEHTVQVLVIKMVQVFLNIKISG